MYRLFKKYQNKRKFTKNFKEQKWNLNKKFQKIIKKIKN